MIEKSLIVIIFLYAVGFMVYAGQFYMADIVPGFTLVSVYGVPLKSNVQNAINLSTINTIELNTTQSATNRAQVVSNPIGQAAGIASELFLLLTGTYVFNIIYLLLGGGDGTHNASAALTVAPFVIIYGFLLMRTIIGYIRGI